MTTEHRVRFTFEGGSPIEVGCRADEDVVTAAFRQGVILFSDCREGICGTCRAFLEEGEYGSLLEYSPHVLSDDEREQGWVLACRLRPLTNLHLDFEYSADRVAIVDPQRRIGQIVSLERPAPTVARVVVRTLGVQNALDWTPGQYVRLHLPTAGVTRAFSMANVPTESRTLEFFVRLRSGGRFSDAILAMRSAGERVELDGPFGTFTLGHDASDVVFVAGGTGLGPILAMLRQAASERSPRAMLLCLGVEEEVELFALPEVARLASQCPSLQVRVTVTRPTDGWAGERGRVLELLTRVLAELSDAARERAYYLCGPPVMVEGAREVLQACGVPHANVHAEPFAATGS